MFVSENNQCITLGAVTFRLNKNMILVIDYPYKWCIMYVMIMNHFPDTNQEQCLIFLWQYHGAIFRRNIYHIYVP